MKVGVVGLGNMGEQIALSFVREGHETHVYDVRPDALARLGEHGAIGADSVADLARDVDVISVVVLNEPQVESVAEAVASASGARTLIVHSTVTPAFVQQLAQRLAPLGIAVLDATVAGGVARARTGDLTVMVGGSEADVATVRPLLDAIGREIFVVGEAGAGSAVKLAVNFMTIAGMALQMEAMEFVRSYGITEASLSTVLATSSADSRAVRTWGFHDRLRRSTPAGTTPAQVVMKKDLSAFAAAAAHSGLLAPLATVAASTLLDKVASRDEQLEKLGPTEPQPRCEVCSLELIEPYFTAGVHPECRT